MSTEKMIKELRRLAGIENDKPHYIGDVRWDILCTDVANRLERSNKSLEKVIKTSIYYYKA